MNNLIKNVLSYKLVLMIFLSLQACSSNDTDRSAYLLADDNETVSYEEGSYDINDFDTDNNSSIRDLVDNEIKALALGNENDISSSNTYIEGVVTVRSNYAFSQILAGSSAEPDSRRVINNGFWIQDYSGGIFIYYDEDLDSDEIKDPDFIEGLAQVGKLVRLKVDKVLHYNAGGGLPIISSFSDYEIQNGDHSYTVFYQEKSEALSSDDIGTLVSIRGEVKSTPEYVELTPYVPPSTEGYCSYPCTYQYQPKYQTTFLSSLEGSDSLSIEFQLNYNLVRGTLDSYALGEGYQSFNVSAGDQLQLIGPVFAPTYTNNRLAVAIEGKEQIIQLSQD